MRAFLAILLWVSARGAPAALSEEEFTAAADEFITDTDKNGDKLLDLEEMLGAVHETEQEAMGLVKDKFAEMDGDGDGKLNQKEVGAMLKYMQDQLQGEL